MGLFSKKTNVQKNEEEFKTKNLENQKIYHELNIRGQDPEILRTQVLGLVEDMGYSVYINKFTKFENSEFENIFSQGRLKPLRAVLKAEKKTQTGSKYPWLWKIFLGLTILSFVAYFLPQSVYDSIGLSVNSIYILIIAIVFALTFILLLALRRFDKLTIWFKTSGIYNVEDNVTDFKLILSGSTTAVNDKVNKLLDNDVSELFRIIGQKYVTHKDDTEKSILKLPKNEKNFDVNLIKEINKIESELNQLDSRLARGEISEKVYYQSKENLKERKIKLETILDLVNK